MAKETKTVRKAIRFTPSFWKRIKRYVAKRKDMLFSDFVTIAIEDKLDREGAKRELNK